MKGSVLSCHYIVMKENKVSTSRLTQWRWMQTSITGLPQEVTLRLHMPPSSPIQEACYKKKKKRNGKPRLARVNVPTSTFLKYPLSGWSLECDPSLLSRPTNMGRTWTGPKRFSKKEKKKKNPSAQQCVRDPSKMVDMQSFPILTSPENIHQKTKQKTINKTHSRQLLKWINTYYVHFLWGDKWTLLLSLMNSVNSRVPDHKTGCACCFSHAWLPTGDNDQSLYCVLIHPHAYVQF